MTTSHPHSDEPQPSESQHDELQQNESQQDGSKAPKQQVAPAQPNNPLHGVTLLKMLEHLVEVYGWEELGHRIDIRCFTHDPSFKSSLKFLRRTDWARAKVERLYLRSLRFNHQSPTPIEVEAQPKTKTKFKWRKLPANDDQQTKEGQ